MISRLSDNEIYSAQIVAFYTMVFNISGANEREIKSVSANKHFWLEIIFLEFAFYVATILSLRVRHIYSKLFNYTILHFIEVWGKESAAFTVHSVVCVFGVAVRCYKRARIA